MTHSIWPCSMILIAIMTTGCFPYKENADQDVVLKTSNLIYEETFSPNEAYAVQEDKVYNTVRVYQNDENKITVIATSNSLLFDVLQYEYDCGEKISSYDIKVKWLTLMGSENGSKTDQLMVADIIISVAGEIISDRKINFASKAMEIIAEIESIK